LLETLGFDLRFQSTGDPATPLPPIKLNLVSHGEQAQRLTGNLSQQDLAKYLHYTNSFSAESFADFLGFDLVAPPGMHTGNLTFSSPQLNRPLVLPFSIDVSTKPSLAVTASPAQRAIPAAYFPRDSSSTSRARTSARRH
jgi:hypothetical protein